MPDWQEIFMHGEDRAEPGPDFEEMVFNKIRKKKKQRKIGFAIMAVAGAVVLLSLFQLFRPESHHAPLSGRQTEKKEIPLHEDLYFSASDNRIRYSIEPVSNQKKPDSQDATLNQI